MKFYLVFGFAILIFFLPGLYYAFFDLQMRVDLLEIVGKSKIYSSLVKHDFIS